MIAVRSQQDSPAIQVVDHAVGEAEQPMPARNAVPTPSQKSDDGRNDSFWALLRRALGSPHFY